MAEVRRLSETPEQRAVLRRAWPHLRPHRAIIAASIAVNLLSTLALTLVPVAIGRAVDLLLARDRTGMLIAAGVVIGLVVVRMLLLRHSELLLTRAGERVVRDLRDLAIERLGSAPLRFVEAHRGGDLLQRVTVEIAELATFVRSQLPDLVSLVGYLVFSTVVLVTYSWPMFLLLVVVFVPPIWWLTRRFQRAARRAYPAEAAAAAGVAATLSESLLAREQLQVAGSTRVWLDRLGRDTDDFHGAVRRTQRAVTWIELTWIVQGLTSGALLVAGGLLVAGDYVTVGVVVTFILASRDLFSSVDDLTVVAGELLESRVGLARLLDLLDATAPTSPAPTSPAPSASEGARRPGGSRPVLVAEAVSYSYQAGEPVLHDVSVSFAPGEHAGLVGETGSGKTTLAKLLCGLYLPDSGTVRCGGTDLSELSYPELRRRLVLIPQQVHMVSGTLADNLALTPGRPGPAQLRRAVDRLGLRDWVATLPGGLDADLGGRGERFSAGERQLVGLIRAAMIDPEVLILDEATADLDPDTARRLETALGHLHEDRTVLVIAHRQATIDRLPRTIRLHAGRLLAAGSPAQHGGTAHPAGEDSKGRGDGAG